MSKNFYTVLSDDEKNEINERFDLVFARVAEIRNEALLPEALRDYTAAVSDCLMALKDASYDGFYGRFASAVYEESFLNPAYAVLRLQDAGGLLSAVYGDIASLMPYAVLGRKDVITIFAELFVELYGIMSIGITEGDLPEDGAPVSEETLHSLKDAVYWFYHDYSEIFAEESILSTIDPLFNDIYDIVMKADLSDLSWQAVRYQQDVLSGTPVRREVQGNPRSNHRWLFDRFLRRSPHTGQVSSVESSISSAWILTLTLPHRAQRL